MVWLKLYDSAARASEEIKLLSSLLYFHFNLLGFELVHQCTVSISVYKE